MHTLLIKIIGYTLCAFSIIIIPGIWLLDDVGVGMKTMVFIAAVACWPFMWWFSWYEKVNAGGVSSQRELTRFLLASRIWYGVMALAGIGLSWLGIHDLLRGLAADAPFHILLGLASLVFAIRQFFKLRAIRGMRYEDVERSRAKRQ